MGRLTTLSFEEWFDLSFARLREKDSSKRDYWNGPLEITLAHLTRAFENAGMVFAPIPDKQLADAFWKIGTQLFVIHDSPSHKSCGTDLSGKDRARAIRSLLTLFTEIFAERCDDHLCYLDYGDGDDEDPRPLNTVCYMWWDIHQSGAHEDDPARDEIDAAILEVLEETLALDSIACQESALHGLGHAIGWHDLLMCRDAGLFDEEAKPRVWPDAALRARAVIDAYLVRNASLMPELMEYALAAKEGGVQ